ncbi:hypothetical protein RB195_011336 [Necator americanus]|uniref:Uncharacterized protein n=1 Tax=Necator americanus TaxID=51031 RepID=A0ABR1D3R3_NECAM
MRFLATSSISTAHPCAPPPPAIRRKSIWTPRQAIHFIRRVAVDIGYEIAFEWVDFVQALAEDREGWAELCPKTAHLGEDAGAISEWFRCDCPKPSMCQPRL